MFEQAENAIEGLLTEDVQQNSVLQQILQRLDAIDARLDNMLSRLEVLEDGDVVEPPPPPPPPDDDDDLLPVIDGDTKTWNLVFQDEFDESVINQDKWALSYWWDWKEIGSTNEGTGELQWYTLGDNIEVRNGVAYLIAKKESVVGERKKQPYTYNYTSAIITTGKPHRGLPEKFPFQYGFVEVKAKIPAGKGLWPAFWLLPVDEQSRPEVDIFEFLGHETTIDRMHFHFIDSRGRKIDVGEHYPPDDNGTVDYSQDFHVFGLDWQQNYLRWYVDGKLAWEITNYVPNEPMYVLLNLAVGGGYPGSPDATTVFPAEFAVDYARIWK